MTVAIIETKIRVRDFWEGGSCGEVYADGEAQEYYASHRQVRYAQEAYLLNLPNLPERRGKDVLEMGQVWHGLVVRHRLDRTRSGAYAKKLALYGLTSDVRVADVYAQHMESPGTKAYSLPEASRMFRRFASADLHT